MSTIKAIEARSVHQIQSGQVIVDLCSVVKELVENSLDAGATSVEVRFKNNGLDLIEVQDNGNGIAPDDYDSIALKHYTSKLSTYDDLSALQTFGFRGEALSSLCAVSNFRVTTAQANQAPRASKLEFETSGKLKGKQIVAGQKGTTVSVENLFRVLPVRRRELEKNIKREYGKVLGLLHAYACISTGVRFSAKSQMPKGKSVVAFSTQGNQTTRENISNIYGAKTLLALTPLELELEHSPSMPARRIARQTDDELNKIIVHGHISKPIFGEGRQTPDRQMFFVNSRPCGLPQIAKAFNEVYRSFNVSQSPFIFADFEMDTSAYDVNVSPDKRTILLHDAGALTDSLKASLTELFESLDQTVPRSQISGTQTLLGPSSKDLFAKPERSPISRSSGDQISHSQEVEEDSAQEPSNDSDRRMKNFVQRFSEHQKAAEPASFPQRQESFPSPVDKSFQKEEMNSIHSSAEDHRSSTPQSPRVGTTPPPEFSQPSEAVDHSQATNCSQTLSTNDPTSSQRSVLSIQSSPTKHKAGVVQNAFERMRSVRPAPEVATITIGDRMVQSTLDGSTVKRKFNHTGNLYSGPQNKRRIHVSSAKQKFGKSLNMFAAPGSQLNGDEIEGEESGEDVDEGKEELVSGNEQSEVYSSAKSRSSSIELETAAGNDESQSVKRIQERRQDEGGLVQGEDASSPNLHEEEKEPDQEGGSEEQGPPDESESDSDESYIDDEEKKAREEAKIAQLIREAEEKANVPSEENVARAKKLYHRPGSKYSTFDLLGNADGSLDRIQAQIRAFQNGRRDIPAQVVPPHLSQVSDIEKSSQDQAKSAEATLSLTVTKDDFSKMRIIGQFNLGFVLATRQSTDILDEQNNIEQDEKERKSRQDELFIIDQHASDEKYNFERLQAETVVQNQRLVKPKTLELTAVEEEIIIENQPALEKNGFVVDIDTSGDEPIGRRCKLVSLPLSKEVVFDTRDLEELLVLLSETPAVQSQDAEDEVGCGSSTNFRSSKISSPYIPRPSKVRKMFAMRACRSSVMVGRTLSLKQMETVVRHMGTIDKPWNCPHGRPTMRHLMSLGQWNEWDEWTGAEEPEAHMAFMFEDESEDEVGISGFWKRYLRRVNRWEGREGEED